MEHAPIRDRVPTPVPEGDDPIDERDSFWHRIHQIESAFQRGLGERDPRETTNALLELDRSVWQAQQDRESPEFISQARDTLRELIVSIGVKLESAPRSRADCLAPLVEVLLNLRQEFRTKKQFDAADAIRENLEVAGIIIEDARQGARWRLK